MARPEESSVAYAAAPVTPKLQPPPPPPPRDSTFKSYTDDSKAWSLKGCVPFGSSGRFQQDAHESPPFSECANPLDSASLITLLTMQWFQPLVSLGARKILEKEDFWPLSQSDRCEFLEGKFNTAYAKATSSIITRTPDKTPHNNTSLLSLIGAESTVGRSLVGAYRREILVATSNFVVYIGAMALQPFIAQAILDFLNDRENLFHISGGYWLVVFMTVISFLAVTCINYGNFVCTRI
ncbi:Abc transporter c family member 2, partial [Globisporangium polare]